MDNLSHSVVGLAAGEFVHRSLPQESDAEQNRVRRRLLLISCWLASNFPDLDLILTPLLPEPLGYLLHHRGHTHTVLYAIPQALLLWGAIWLLWPAARSLLKRSNTARTGFALTVFLGFALHLMMDSLNSYGIHPFHPFDSRWFYGDMVFIVEPLFWVAFGVPVIMAIQRIGMRILLLALMTGAILYFTMKEFLPWISFVLLLALALVMGSIQRKADARGNAAFLLAAVIGIGFIGVQAYASHRATQALVQHLNGKDPESRFLDAAMTSFPANPLCWTFVSIESKETAGIYRLRRGVLSLMPDTIPATECPARFSEVTLPDPASPAIAFQFEQEARLDMLRQLFDENCHFNAWMRFARTPLVLDGHASDMRFSSTPHGNFTTMNFDDFKNRECSQTIPQWGYPRSDLLESSSW